MPKRTRRAVRALPAPLVSRLLGGLVATALVAAGAFGCTRSEEGGSHAALVRRGEVVFQSTCTACHARDPNHPGPVGPPIAGSSLELLRAKVLHGEYPPGYRPKRTTQAMVPLPHVEPDLPAIAAYLQSVKR